MGFQFSGNNDNIVQECTWYEEKTIFNILKTIFNYLLIN